ncbi:plasmid mobilization protein [Janibacter terrae]|uniref:plasmid mobilization protein n=1 Tax=Janibacter terrae TaxID=103817 RepID=UPI0031F8428E
MSDVYGLGSDGAADGGSPSATDGAAGGDASNATAGSRGLPGVGRRSDALRDKREIVLTLRVSAAERRQIERQAQRRGIGISALLRGAVLDLDDDQRLSSVQAVQEPTVESTDVTELRDALRELRVQYKGVHSNLNQLTRRANAQGSVATHVTVDGEQVQLSDVLLETRAIAGQVLTNLGARGHG